MATSTSDDYRSATEFSFSRDQADPIVRTAAYHRTDFSLAVIYFPPREHIDIHLLTSTLSQRASSVGLGSLDSLPLELLHELLCCLDVYSVFKFRQINRSSRQLVESLGQYRLAVSHGLNLFCALLRTRLATDISLLSFYNALCTKACTLCGEFGGFMSLLMWKRCCFKCINEAPELQLQTLAASRKRYHLNKVHIRQLRSFRSLPGVYSMEEIVRKSRVVIVSVNQAILISKGRERPLAQIEPGNSKQTDIFNFMGSCALPYYDRLSGKVEHGISCAGCQLAIEKYIIGTRGEKWALDARDKVYAEDGFLEHFRWCAQAQLLWLSSDEGIKRPIMLPEVARRGGYFSLRE